MYVKHFKNYDIKILVLDLTIEEGYEVLSKCIREIHKRVVINLPNFKVQVVTRNGIKNLEPITAAKLARESKD